LNGIYTIENELLNDMPYYLDNARRYAIWFNNGWFIGSFSYIEEGKSTLRFRGFVDCPTESTDTKNWLEYFDGEWNTNLNVKLTEYSKKPKYYGSRFLKRFLLHKFYRLFIQSRPVL